MKAAMEAAHDRLARLLDEHEATAGMYVRVHGDHLIIGRQEDDRLDDRVKLTRLAKDLYGLSVKRHTGRWQRTPFSGSLPEVFSAITSFMQHLVSRY